MSKNLKGADSILGLTDITDNKLIWRMLVAEFLGTLLLVVIGCGSVITSDGDDFNIIQIALTFGLTVASIVQAIGHVSGGHINPAVTLSLFVTGDIKLLRAIFFVVMQCVGAVAGSAILRMLIPDEERGLLGLTNKAVSLSNVQGFFIEAVLTFLLVFVIHGVGDPRRKDISGSAPLAIGFSIAACHLCGIKLTGSSLNPARSFGPAVILNLWDNHWIYWAGPIVGGVLAGLIYKFLFKVQKGDSDSYDF